MESYDLPLRAKPFHATWIDGFVSENGKAVGGTFKERLWTREEYQDLLKNYAKTYHHLKLWAWVYPLRTFLYYRLLPKWVYHRLPDETKVQMRRKSHKPELFDGRFAYVTITNCTAIGDECDGKMFIQIGEA